LEGHAFLMVAAVGMWSVMMCGMMAPAAWPWVRAFHAFGARDRSPSARVWSTASFAAGYVAAWLVYSIIAAGAHLMLARSTHVPDALPPVPAGLLLIGAGLFQFTSLKRSCLTHCRSPFSYFLARWHNGPTGAFRMGLGHGVYCVACCWALMATAFAVGMASVWWMAALAAAVVAEQSLPHGERVRQILGAMLLAGGVTRALVP
jgi:predicted metal-binding membrane protein